LNSHQAPSDASSRRVDDEGLVRGGAGEGWQSHRYMRVHSGDL